ncbi:ABC transporter ATP-binding protein, partial [Listeria welshimeri]|nr:ABC transporter ATP-binding protein [Listeria welshimeri]
MIRFDNVSKKYDADKTAVNNVTLDIK